MDGNIPDTNIENFYENNIKPLLRERISEKKLTELCDKLNRLDGDIQDIERLIELLADDIVGLYSDVLNDETRYKGVQDIVRTLTDVDDSVDEIDGEKLATNILQGPNVLRTYMANKRDTEYSY